MVKIAPSILSANSSEFGKEVCLLQEARADLIHFDVMDGHFVPNITYGPKILEDLKPLTNLQFDTHLMVCDPLRFIPWYAHAGANYITFHIEAVNNPVEVINSIKKFGAKVGISVKPKTDISSLVPYLDMIDLILIMSVEPGFGGQEFIPEIPNKIRNMKKTIQHRSILIEVDGGITPTTAKLCIDAGADILVAGTSVFKNKNYFENIQALRGK